MAETETLPAKEKLHVCLMAEDGVLQSLPPAFPKLLRNFVGFVLVPIIGRYHDRISTVSLRVNVDVLDVVITMHAVSAAAVADNDVAAENAAIEFGHDVSDWVGVAADIVKAAASSVYGPGSVKVTATVQTSLSYTT